MNIKPIMLLSVTSPAFAQFEKYYDEGVPSSSGLGGIIIVLLVLLTLFFGPREAKKIVLMLIGALGYLIALAYLCRYVNGVLAPVIGDKLSALPVLGIFLLGLYGLLVMWQKSGDKY